MNGILFVLIYDLLTYLLTFDQLVLKFGKFSQSTQNLINKKKNIYKTKEENNNRNRKGTHLYLTNEHYMSLKSIVNVKYERQGVRVL